MPRYDDEDEFDEDRRPSRRSRRASDEDDYDDGLGADTFKPHRGPMVLVFGILSLVMCGAFGIAAWMMGKNDLREIDSGRMDPEGRPLTQVGYILGIVGCVIFTLQLLAFTAYFVIIAVVIAGKQ